MIFKFSKKDKFWLEKCKSNPKTYRIYVDNDNIYVEYIYPDGELGSDLGDSYAYTFDNYGQDFIIQILNYLGCNVDYE